MITVACVLVRGHVGFTTEYVTKLKSMVERHLKRPHRFVCLTDRPHLLDCETIPIQTPRDIFAWWAKVELFNSANGLDGRVLYLDLDVLIVGDLDEIVDYPAPFALVPHAGQWQGKGRLKVVPLYNSSVMVFDAERVHRLYSNWSPPVTERLWGDQDWIGERMPGEATMPLKWFPRLSEINNGTDLILAPGARVVLCKKPKNHVARQTWRWFDQMWR